jgi:hypothetical protein
MLERIVATTDLMLDPNNPRFVNKFNSKNKVDDCDIENEQSSVLKCFTKTQNSNSDSVFEIDDLWNSMNIIGFIGVDRVVVRKIDNSNKFLVIEGNRRIATAKKLIIHNDEENNPDNKLNSNIVNSLQNIEVCELKTEGMSSDEIDHEISVILGLRHYGSVLEWKPLPKAFNTYSEYLHINPQEKYFKYNNQRIIEVASRLSVKPIDVRNACKTYIVYKQLNEFAGVDPQYYSLIQAAVTNKTLSGKSCYFRIDPNSYEMDEPSLDLLYQLCQFDCRKDISPKDKIISDPKHFKHLAKIVKANGTHDNESIRIYAGNLLRELESGNSNVEKSSSLLVDFINQKEWVVALRKNLDKQEIELNIDEFDPSGNAVMYLDEIIKTFNNLRKIWFN